MVMTRTVCRTIVLFVPLESDTRITRYKDSKKVRKKRTARPAPSKSRFHAASLLAVEASADSLHVSGMQATWQSNLCCGQWYAGNCPTLLHTSHVKSPTYGDTRVYRSSHAWRSCRHVALNCGPVDALPAELAPTAAVAEIKEGKRGKRFRCCACSCNCCVNASNSACCDVSFAFNVCTRVNTGATSASVLHALT